MATRIQDIGRASVRGQLLTLARQQIRFPNTSVVAEVAELAVVADRYICDDAFTALCNAVRDHDNAATMAALNTLAGAQ